MIAAKMHSDRARKELTKGASGQKKPRETIRIKDKVAAKETFPLEETQAEAEVFRRSTAAALAASRIMMNARPSVTFNETMRKRSSVVAVVTKRVELLHMNVISREFTQVLGDEEDTRIALQRKQAQEADTWREMCTVPIALEQAGDTLTPTKRFGGSAPNIGFKLMGHNKDGRGNNADGEDEGGSEDTDLPQGTRFLVHPHGKAKVKWDLMVAGMIVYSTLSVPFRIGFGEAAGVFGAVVDTVVDIGFSLDIVLSFRTAFVDENGETVVDVRAISRRYLKAWFAIDFISTVPIDKLALLFVGDDNAVLRSTKMLRILRLARLFKLMRLFKLQSKVAGEEERPNKINPSVTSLIKMLVYMTYIAHILGCMWHWLASFGEGGISWASKFGVEEASLATRYVASIYWAFTTMTTVGYGDIVVTTTAERCFCVFGMLIGATVFGYIVGNVSVMMESFDLQSALRTQKMDRVKEYIISRRFPQKFGRRVLQQYKYHFKRISVLDNYAILESLPTTARTSLLFAQYHDAVDQLSFLQNNPPIFVANLVGALAASYAKPGDVLFYQEEVASDLYFLVTGKVNLYATFSATIASETSATNTAYSARGPFARQTFMFAKVFKDSRIGEAGVMLDIQQPVAAVAMAACDLFTIGKEDLLSALDGYVKVQASLIEDAEDFMKRFNEFKRRKGAEHDPEESSDDAGGGGGVATANKNDELQLDANHGSSGGDCFQSKLPPLQRVSATAAATAAAAVAAATAAAAGGPPHGGRNGGPSTPATSNALSSPSSRHARSAQVKLQACSTIKLSALKSMDIADIGFSNDGGLPAAAAAATASGGTGDCSSVGSSATIGGGLLVASVSECDSSAFGDDFVEGGASEVEDDSEDSDDSDDSDEGSCTDGELTQKRGSVYEDRRRPRSAASLQFKQLAESVASDVAKGGSPATSNLIKRITLKRKFRRASCVLPGDGRPALLLPSRSSKSLHTMNFGDEDEDSSDSSKTSTSIGGDDVAHMRDIDESIRTEAGRDVHTDNGHASQEDTTGSRDPGIENVGGGSGGQPADTAAHGPSSSSFSLPQAGEAAEEEPVPGEVRDSRDATIDAFPRSRPFSVEGVVGARNSWLRNEQLVVIDEAASNSTGTGRTNALGTGASCGDDRIPPVPTPGSQGRTGDSEGFAATAAATLPTILGSADGALAGAAGVRVAVAEEERRPSRRISLKTMAQAVRRKSIELLASTPRPRQYRQYSGGNAGKLPDSPYKHAHVRNELDTLSDVSMSEAGEEEPVGNLKKKKNMNFMNVHQDTQTRFRNGPSTSVQQLALNELSPRVFWGRLHVVHPDSLTKAVWDVFVAFFIVFSVLEVTFRLGFDAQAQGSWAIFGHLVDFLFLCDMLVSFDCAFWDDGNIITSRNLIAREYLRTWFIVDFVSTVPLDTIFAKLVLNAGALRGTKLIRMIRLVRLFKIFRLLKMSTFFERYQEAMPMNPAVIRLTKLVILMSFVAHLAACVWYAVGAYSITAGDNSWILDYCINDGFYSTCLDEQGLGARYIASVYWAFTTMTTVGYGDITPANNVSEMLTALVSEVAGTTLFAYVIGALVTIVLNLDPQTRLRKQKVEYLSEYMRDFNMTLMQKTEMKRHFNFKLEFNSVFPEHEILSILPPYLRIPAVLYAYRTVVPRLPLLCQIEMSYPGFLAMMLPRLKPGEYVKGDLIVSPRLAAQEMGFVVHGVCEEISVETNKSIQNYREGQYMGHATLLVPDGLSFKVLVEVRAIMRVKMLILLKSDFDYLLTFYPPPMERLRDELTDWVEVLRWISLPKVYAKKIRRIAQMKSGNTDAGSGSGGGGGGWAGERRPSNPQQLAKLVNSDGVPPLRRSSTKRRKGGGNFGEGADRRTGSISRGKNGQEKREKGSRRTSSRESRAESRAENKINGSSAAGGVSGGGEGVGLDREYPLSTGPLPNPRSS